MQHAATASSSCGAAAAAIRGDCTGGGGGSRVLAPPPLQRAEVPVDDSAVAFSILLPWHITSAALTAPFASGAGIEDQERLDEKQLRPQP